MEPEPPAEIEPPANVLLVHATRGESDACAALRHEHDPTAELSVTFGDDQPTEPNADDVDGTVGLLRVGDLLHSTGDVDPDFTDTVVVDSVCDPTDLGEIGVAISRFCKHWEESDERITVCFDSLDALLCSSAPKRVFQFTHVLTTRLASVDASAHFHFDPTRHEDRVVSTFGTIFDAVVADEDAEDSLPEATDEEVADLLAEWNDGAAGTIEFEPTPTAEATDEDIARILEK
ncbi:DUF7504 family protein [Natronorubrum texcoconense]|uniref:RecA-superfamily ATPase, KaiC/GvpD/RAD55 family n=1 Tax=Natronorubrum texcoconense TaxID=1095776 RepID=A0A1G9BM16_9EURY|nr:hypothetical protein [Natronorubrum texcoconense]SDK40526.1 hypothetical protein SAMN04515672_3015 [Natronorubrum texcoconense]